MKTYLSLAVIALLSLDVDAKRTRPVTLKSTLASKTLNLADDAEEPADGASEPADDASQPTDEDITEEE